jgi:hypothetical protein
MSRQKKLISRLLAKPSDFNWSELTKLLAGFGYHETNMGKTSGSRVRFIKIDCPPIILHKPHPTPNLKRYQLENIIKFLKQEELI